MLTFTDRAQKKIREFIDQSDGELEALRVSMSGSPLAPNFELALVNESERRPEERIFDSGDFTVLVSEAQIGRLEGARVDFVETENESGFEIRPNRGKPVGSPEGPLADQVTRVLDEQVNPTIAAHGGAITLVDVQGTEIYLEMSGGCQGCAMSRLTLRQGVERMLREAVGAITAVHDVTDHAEGSQPYYERPA